MLGQKKKQFEKAIS